MPWGKLTGALQYGFLVFLGAAEALPQSRPLALVHTGFFAVLAAAIVANSIWCIRAVARTLRQHREE